MNSFGRLQSKLKSTYWDQSSSEYPQTQLDEAFLQNVPRCIYSYFQYELNHPL